MPRWQYWTWSRTSLSWGRYQISPPTYVSSAERLREQVQCVTPSRDSRDGQMPLHVSTL